MVGGWAVGDIGVGGGLNSLDQDFRILRLSAAGFEDLFLWLLGHRTSEPWYPKP